MLCLRLGAPEGQAVTGKPSVYLDSGVQQPGEGLLLWLEGHLPSAANIAKINDRTVSDMYLDDTYP